MSHQYSDVPSDVPRTYTEASAVGPSELNGSFRCRKNPGTDDTYSCLCRFTWLSKKFSYYKYFATLLSIVSNSQEKNWY